MQFNLLTYENIQPIEDQVALTYTYENKFH